MEILLFKKTTDFDLKTGLQVCYKDINGVYSKLGTITNIVTEKGCLLYILNTSFGAYTADELKLIKH